jgi:hypothetical protein
MYATIGGDACTRCQRHWPECVCVYLAHTDRCPDCGKLFDANDWSSVRCEACTKKGRKR